MQKEPEANIPLDEQSDYKLFEKEQLNIIMNEHPDWNEKEVTSAIQIKWNGLGEDKKKV
jgi:hypothetical protein